MTMSLQEKIHKYSNIFIFDEQATSLTFVRASPSDAQAPSQLAIQDTKVTHADNSYITFHGTLDKSTPVIIKMAVNTEASNGLKKEAEIYEQNNSILQSRAVVPHFYGLWNHLSRPIHCTVVQHCSMPKVEPQLHDLSPELK